MIDTIQRYLDEELGDSKKISAVNVGLQAHGIDTGQYNRRLLTTLVFDKDDFVEGATLCTPCRLTLMRRAAYEENFGAVANIAPVVAVCAARNDWTPVTRLNDDALQKLRAMLERSLIVLPLYLRANGKVDACGINMLQRSTWSETPGKLVLKAIRLVDVFVCGRRFTPDGSSAHDARWIARVGMTYNGAFTQTLRAVLQAQANRDVELIARQREQEEEMSCVK